jgi:uncharacterized protein YcfL
MKNILSVLLVLTLLVSCSDNPANNNEQDIDDELGFKLSFKIRHR